MTLAIAFVLLDGPPALPPGPLGDALQHRWPESTVASVEEEKDIISFELDGHSIFVAPMPGPVPWSDLEGPCATTLFWENATEEVKGHSHHLLVTVQGETDPVTLRSSLTRAVTSTLDATPNALGVYWGDAGLVIRKDLFVDFATSALPDPPVPLWVGIRVGPGENDRTVGFTQGLAELGLMDMETNTSTDAPGELYERLLDIVSYLVANGPVIEDGHSVGRTAKERILVRYGPSEFGLEGDVMHLDWGEKKRPWWKLGN